MTLISFKWGDVEHTLDTDFDSKAIAYLVQYGANKSRQDAVAGLAKAIIGEGSAAWSANDREEAAKELGITQYDDSLEGRAALADMWIAKEQEDRWTAIIDGTIGSRGPTGPRRKGRDAMLFDQAEAHLRLRVAQLNATRKGKIVLPDKAKDLRPYVEKELVVYREEIERQVDAAAEMAAQVSEDDPLGLGL